MTPMTPIDVKHCTFGPISWSLYALKHIFLIHKGHKYLNKRFPSNAAVSWQLLISPLLFNSIDVVRIPVHSLSFGMHWNSFINYICLIYWARCFSFVKSIWHHRNDLSKLIKNPAKQYIPKKSADENAKEFLLCEEFAGICIIVFEAWIYYYNKKIDYGGEKQSNGHSSR